jgi:hypothetical protein
MSANEKAEATLIVLKRIVKAILKWTLILILIIFAFGFVGWIYLTAESWYSVDRHKDKIEVIASFDKKICELKEYPLMIMVVNGSEKTIDNITIDVAVTRIGYSSKLNSYKDFKYDKIIAPRESWVNCWRVDNADYGKPALTGVDMEVRVTSFYPTFKK